MLAPMAQRTCSMTAVRPPSCSRPNGANVYAVERTVTSMKIIHRPRVARKAASADGLLRAAISPALVPASNTNTGAQKWVTQRVMNKSGLIFVQDFPLGDRLISRVGDHPEGVTGGA